ncbi:PAS domain S-box protein [Haloarcula nitratireducens]|uniref:PAS domain S-box protein n=1 Tax=Haloarcula nitratireducens TaxID=2487749 RepID=A0AAW4PCN7_9EURY|nr:PAS domain S-box protein [Halomicroarcula nitratireducens]MBX0295679.1 PAS domain S-box protein [Halomicroarcula nitratireducens]
MDSAESTRHAFADALAAFDSTPSAPLTASEVADAIDCSRRTAYNRLEQLVEDGLLETKKVGASGRVWWRSRPTTASPPTAGLAHGSYESVVSDVFGTADVGVFLLDSDFDVVWINDATVHYFGLDSATVVGRDKRQLIRETIGDVVAEPGDFAETVIATYDDNTYAEEFECRITAGDGRDERWLEHRSKPIETGEYAGGRVELYYDITDQKASERALREREHQFRSLVQAVDEYAIFMLDPDGRVVTWNEGAERIKGCSREAAIGRHVSTFYTEADCAENVPKRNLATAARDGFVRDEGWRVRKDGTRFWANVTISAIRDDDGTLQGYAKVIQDLTDRRERERQLHHERDLVENLFDVSPTGLMVFGTDDDLQRSNSRAKDVLGLSHGECYAAGDVDLVGPDGQPLSFEERPLGRTLKTGEAVTNQVVQGAQATDGDRRWFSISTRPIRDDDGNLEQVVVCADEITELKEQARQLEQQRDSLQHELDEVFARVDDAFYALDDEYRFTYVNDRAAELLGHPEATLRGRNVWEAMDVDADDPIRERFETAMATQESQSFERFSEPLGIWEIVRIYPSESGLSVYFRDITKRKEDEQELAALNHLNTIVRDITDAVIDQSTREEIEQVVCDALAEADVYEFAWIANVDPKTNSVQSRIEAGVDGYIDEVSLSVDSDDPHGQGPTGRAIHTHDVQVTRDAFSDPAFEPWRDLARDYGYQSSAAIPIVYEDTLYGIIGVYSARKDAFQDSESEALGQLGEVVGHAIAALERKHALMTNTVVELEFRIPRFVEGTCPGLDADGEITLDQTIPVGDGVYLQYGTVTDDAVSTLEAFVDELPFWDDVTIMEQAVGDATFELRLTEPPVVSAIASRGGRVKHAHIGDGDLEMTVHLPHSVDVHRITDVLQDTYPETKLMTRHSVVQTDDMATRVAEALVEDLTDRQRAVVEAAYHAGFFEWPRRSSGEEVADSLNIAGPTFHQHLRLAQQKLLGELVAGATASVGE